MPEFQVSITLLTRNRRADQHRILLLWSYFLYAGNRVRAKRSRWRAKRHIAANRIPRTLTLAIVVMITLTVGLVAPTTFFLDLETFRN